MWCNTEMLTDAEHKTKIAAMRKAKLEALETGTCLHPEAPNNCSGNPISAHTVQEKLLRQIAENQHVFAIEADEFNVRHIMALKGVKEASTFPGFCNSHDTELFLSIEGNNSLKINGHHALLLAYRALSMEIYSKRAYRSADLLKYVPSHLITSEERRLHTSLPSEISKLLSLAEPLFDRMASAYLHEDYKDMNYYAVKFAEVPDILCSGAIIANLDFRGYRLRRTPGHLDIITLSILPYDSNNGVAVFAWHGQSTASANLVRSLNSLHKLKISDAIVKLVFRLSTNYYLRPTWWHALENDKKDTFRNRPEGMWESFDLTPDPIKYVDWKIIGKYSNFRL